MMAYEDKTRELGRIESIFFGRSDRAVMTLSVGLDFGGSCQSFCGMALDIYDKEADKRIGTAAGMDLYMRLLDFFDVDELHKAKGMTAYALRVDTTWHSQIIGLERVRFEGGAKFMLSDWVKAWGLT
jgi:hypothetical protein